MERFANYYIRFLKDFFVNFWEYFSGLFTSLWKFIYTDTVGYFNDLATSSTSFNALDWIMTVLVIIVNIVFVVFILIKLFQLLRRYVRFIRREIEKDDLLEEMAALHQRIIELIHEKNEIFTLKMESLGFTAEQIEKLKLESGEEVVSRFAKLIQVDKKYKDMLTDVVMKETDTVSLEELVTRFINFSAFSLGLFYDRRIVSTFFAGMATSHLIILEGISGTGKTSLPYAMGKFFRNDAHIISVQPSWRDRSEMLGYLNEFTKKFNETDFLASLYETTYRHDLNFIVLDEMNLARVEYYFADFLSIMEMPDREDWKIEIVPVQEKGDPKNLINGEITIPENVWFIGTANKDDSTFTITDKVYDRATPVEMNHRAPKVDAIQSNNISMSQDYLFRLFDEAIEKSPLTEEVTEKLIKLDAFIAEKFKVTFGNRIMKQFSDFVPVFVSARGGTEVDALDFLMARKIFRKFETLNLPFLQEELLELIDVIDSIFGVENFKESMSLIKEYQKHI